MSEHPKRSLCPRKPCHECDALQIDRLKAELEVARWVPGAWACPTCSFSMTKNVIDMAAGEIGASLDRSREVCPNEGSTMLPVSWTQWADNTSEGLQELAEQRNVAELALKEITELAGPGGDDTPFGRVESMLSSLTAELQEERTRLDLYANRRGHVQLVDDMRAAQAELKEAHGALSMAYGQKYLILEEKKEAVDALKESREKNENALSSAKHYDAKWCETMRELDRLREEFRRQEKKWAVEVDHAHSVAEEARGELSVVTAGRVGLQREVERLKAELLKTKKGEG